MDNENKIFKPTEEERKRIHAKWDKLGFLDGLKGHIKPELAAFYKSEPFHILNNENMKKITTLAIFDFDGTLVDSPLPDVGRVTWKEKTGNDWPHQGWWGKPESLDGAVFDMEVIQEVVDDLNGLKDENHVSKIMMTGRMTRLSEHVKKILDDKGLHFDEYHYNTGGDTLSCKIKTLERLIRSNIDVDTILMWEDREEHVKAFTEWAQTLDGINVVVKHIDSQRHPK